MTVSAISTGIPTSALGASNTRRTSPLRGLLTFTLYGIVKSLLPTLGLIAVIGILAIVTGEPLIFSILMLGYLMIPVSVLISIGKAEKWDRYQVTMPIRRKTLILAKIIPVVLSSIFGTLLVSAILWLAAQRHGDAFSNLMQNVYTTFSISLLMLAIIIPLSTARWFQNKLGALMALAIIGSMFLMIARQLLVVTGGFTVSAANAILVTASALMLIAAYFITILRYAKTDF